MVGDGDPHNVMRPDNVYPRRAAKVLEQIVARDPSPQSASTSRAANLS